MITHGNLVNSSEYYGHIILNNRPILFGSSIVWQQEILKIVPKKFNSMWTFTHLFLVVPAHNIRKGHTNVFGNIGAALSLFNKYNNEHYLNSKHPLKTFIPRLTKISIKGKNMQNIMLHHSCNYLVQNSSKISKNSLFTKI